MWTSITALARAHTLALTTRKAGNERFLVLNGAFDNQELADIIHASTSISASMKMRVPVGEMGSRIKGKHFTANSSKVADILGLDLRRRDESLEETIAALVQQLLDLEQDTLL